MSLGKGFQGAQSTGARSSLALAALFLLSACGGSTGPVDGSPPDGNPPDGGGPAGGPTRGFRMGFTPFPYAATAEAIDDVYAKLQANGDVIAHHLDGGVPWPEALAGTPYDLAVEAELADRLARTGPGDVVYLAITPMNSKRSGLADYWGASQGLPRPGEWAARDFDTPEVIQAFVGYALDLIDRFGPMWFNYGIEISELAISDPDAMDRLVTFASQVYPQIKAAHPELPTFVSVAFKGPGSPQAAEIRDAFARLLPYSDYVGVSVYPFVFFGHPNAGDPANLPADWLRQARDLAPDKPLVVAETAWIAEPLLIPEFGVNTAADAQDQNDYVERLLSEADALGAELVIWFFTVDFDSLWEGLLGRDPVARIWRDTGLWDETLAPRPALSTWQAWLDRPRR